MLKVCQSQPDDIIKLSLRLFTSNNLFDDAFVQIQATNVSNITIPQGISIISNISSMPIIKLSDQIKPGNTVSVKIQFSPLLENIVYTLNEISFLAVDKETQEPMSKMEKFSLRSRFEDKLARAKEYLYMKFGVESLPELCSKQDEFNFGYVSNLSVPRTNGEYQFNIARTLVEMTLDVSLTLCNMWVPNPPDFPIENKSQVYVFDKNLTFVLLGYTFWNLSTGYAAIVFSDTMVPAQLRYDADAELIQSSAINGYKDGVMVHNGYYNLYMLARNQLWSWWFQFENEIKTLYITGHGRGGAISTLCAFDFADVFKSRDDANNSISGQNELKQQPIHYTFGSPKCGNEAFSKEFNKRVSTSIRIFNSEDRVTLLPSDAEYQHVGSDIELTDIPKGNYLYNHIAVYRHQLPWSIF